VADDRMAGPFGLRRTGPRLDGACPRTPSWRCGIAPGVRSCRFGRMWSAAAPCARICDHWLQRCPAGCRVRIKERRASCMRGLLADGQRKSVIPMAARL